MTSRMKLVCELPFIGLSALGRGQVKNSLEGRYKHRHKGVVL
jgi:hypothetical protein